MSRRIPSSSLALCLVLLMCCFSSGEALAQAHHWSDEPDAAPDASLQARLLPEGLTLSGFLDAYYVYDFGRPGDHQRPGFLYNHTRTDEFSINLALIKLALDRERVHGAVALMGGTYSEYNYAFEQDNLQMLQEAWGGVSLLPEGRLWLDAGVFGSHIGFESALSSQNPTLTRSLTAENSPYFLSGARLTWQAADTFTAALILANGWQNIRETPGNRSKGGGAQLIWSPSERFSLNSSSWVSNEAPDSAPQLRLFHDLYATLRLGQRTSLWAGLDTGMQRRASGSGWDRWYGAVLIARQQWSPMWGTALRLERYVDREQVIIPTADGQPGVALWAASANVDLTLFERAMLRLEGRYLRNEFETFSLNSDPSRDNVALSSSLALSF